MLTVLYNYSNAKNYTNSANINYADKVLTIRTYAKYTNNTNSANTNCTIYANKLLTIPSDFFRASLIIINEKGNSFKSFFLTMQNWKRGV